MTLKIGAPVLISWQTSLKRIFFPKVQRASKIMQQTGFHLRSSTWETNDLAVSKRVNESFLAKGDIYAYRVSGRATSPFLYKN